MADKVANPERGEVEIELGGKTYVMRPTFGAIAEIETRTGVGLGELTERVIKGGGKVTELTAIVTAGMTAAGEPAIYEKVGQMIYEQGVRTIARPVIEFLGQAVTGGKLSGEEEATESE